MRHIAAPTLWVAVFCATVVAQVEEIKQAEQRIIEARRTGQGLPALLTDDYVAIIPPGTTGGVKEALAAKPNPKAGGNPTIQVRTFGDAALVTGEVDGPQGTGRDRFLRVWVKQAGQWKAAVWHLTWIGLDRVKGAQPLLPEPTGVSFGYKPSNPSEEAIWKQHEAVERAGAAGDQAAYRDLTTSDFVRVTPEGAAVSREQWIQRQKGSRNPSKQTNVRVRVYGDLAVMTYLNVGAGPEPNPELGRVHHMTRIFAKQSDGNWKLLLTQSTPARQPAA